MNFGDIAGIQAVPNVQDILPRNVTHLNNGLTGTDGKTSNGLGLVLLVDEKNY